MNILESKTTQKVAAVLAGLGGLNWGLSKWLNFDILSFVPEGIITTVAVAAIAISGGLVIYYVIQKKI